MSFEIKENVDEETRGWIRMELVWLEMDASINVQINILPNSNVN